MPSGMIAPVGCRAHAPAATHVSAALPVIGGTFQFAVLGKIGGLGEGIDRALAVTQTPSGKAGGPMAFRHPRPCAIGDSAGQREGVAVLILDVE